MITVVLSLGAPLVREYQRKDGSHPFSEWFATLDVQAALRIRVAIARIEVGNFSNTKSLGQGVCEYRLDFGPGYRIYFGRDGVDLVILLGGGTKRRQDKDILAAKQLWQDYKQRKAEESTWP